MGVEPREEAEIVLLGGPPHRIQRREVSAPGNARPDAGQDSEWWTWWVEGFRSACVAQKGMATEPCSVPSVRAPLLLDGWATPDKLHKYRKKETKDALARWAMFLLVAGLLFLFLGVMKSNGVLPHVAWDTDPDMGGFLVGNTIIDQMKTQRKRIMGQEIDSAQIARARTAQEKRQATGRELLLAGINSALQNIMLTRGQIDPDNLSVPDLEEALSLFRHAADVFSSTYDGKGDEILERDYFLAVSDEALLQLFQRDCDEMDRVLHEAEHKIDLDKKEKAQVALLRGYCLEGEGSNKAALYFHLARELSPTCHETLLDTLYQPSAYGHSDHMPRDINKYYSTLLDLHVFRELYLQRHILTEDEPQLSSTEPLPPPPPPPPPDEAAAASSTTNGTEHAEPLWSPDAFFPADTYGANIGWGLNQAGLDRAHDLVTQNEFVILREFFHPYELAVLERYYRKSVEDDNLNFDAFLGRAVSYNDRVGMYLNHRYTETITHVMGTKVKHAYSFLCHYETRDGNKPHLRPHTDREDNQFTVSAQIYSDKEEPLWPIFVHNTATLPARSNWRDMPPRDSVIECGVRNGDALLFLGRRHVHYRETMPQELNMVASLLLHFVSADFDFFDYKLVRQARDPSI